MHRRPTGSGKTVIGSAIIHRLENRMILWLTHRRELVFQPREELSNYFDITAGVMLAGQQRNHMARVQIAVRADLMVALYARQ